MVATLLGTMVAFALARHRFRGRAATNLLVFLPMATPEVVLGASLLALFLNLRLQPGFWTIVIAHIMFCVSFVVVTVKARLAGLDPRLEQAAMDLYADEWQTFRRVTLPLAAPGILAAALLAFALSFDDFIITNFNSGNVTTFPKFVYVSAARGIPPQANVIGTGDVRGGAGGGADSDRRAAGPSSWSAWARSGLCRAARIADRGSRRSRAVVWVAAFAQVWRARPERRQGEGRPRVRHAVSVPPPSRPRSR